MKLTYLKGCSLLAALSLGATSAKADVTTYNDGDLFIGFRSPNDANDFLVDLGPASFFRTATSFSINLFTDLSSNTLFGPDFFSAGDVKFSIIGGNNFAGSGDPANTIYTGDADTSPYVRGSGSAQSVTITKITTMGNAYDGNLSTVSTPTGLIQAKSSDNSYASYQPGGTTANAGGGDSSFAAFSPSNEVTLGQTLYVDRLAPTTSSDNTRVILGTFSVSAAGVASYSQVPEPTSMTLLTAGLALLGLSRFRRKTQLA